MSGFMRKLVIPYIGSNSLKKTKTSSCYYLSSTTTTTKHALLCTNAPVTKPAFDSNIVRILRNQLYYISLHFPPTLQPAVEFRSFTVEERPGEQCITMTGKYGEYETIKIEATMFDGSAMVSKSGDGIAEAEMSFHISLLIDITKGGHDLEFVCSAWSDHIEIQKVYVVNHDKPLYRPYMGPNFRDLHTNFQNALADFLKERGINDDLSVFLHDFMLNKDRVELIKWLKKVKSYVEK